MNGWLRYIGAEANKVLTHGNLQRLGAWTQELEALGENAAVSFIKNVAQHIEPGLAQFIADHPALSGEFQTLTDDEAAAEVAQRKGPQEPTTDTSTPSSSTGSSTDSATASDAGASTSDSSSASGAAENVEPAAPAKSSN